MTMEERDGDRIHLKEKYMLDNEDESCKEFIPHIGKILRVEFNDDEIIYFKLLEVNSYYMFPFRLKVVMNCHSEKFERNESRKLGAISNWKLNYYTVKIYEEDSEELKQSMVIDSI